jgi:ribosomal protein S17E
MNAYALLTGTADTSLNNVTIDFDGDKHFVKEFVRKNTKNFANSPVQQKCAELLLEQMGDDIGVTFRDNKRTISKNEREERLALQNYKCAIDGERLELDDSVWGHDTPWAKGGVLDDGAVIRRTHNTDMGSTTLDEYRMILELRKKKIA